MFRERRARWYGGRISKNLEKLRRLGYELVKIQTHKSGKVTTYIKEKR